METKQYRLGDVCKLRNGYAFKSENFSNEGIPIIRISDIYDDEASPDDSLKINESNVFEKFVVRKGDILIAMSGATTGKFGRYNSDRKAYQNQRVGCFVITDEENLNQDYLYLLLKGLKKKIEKDAYGGGQPNISSAIIENYKIQLPSLEDQSKISSVLNKAEIIIKKREITLNLAEELLKSVFYKLFGTVSSPKFLLKPLNTYALKITDGTHQSPKFVDSGIPFLFVSNIKNNEIIYDTNTYISEEEYNELIKRTPIEIGDILYTSVGSYGNPAIVKTSKKFCFQRHIAYIKPDQNKINYIFLFGALKSQFVKYQVDRLVRGAAQKTLNLGDLKSILIPDVPEVLQVKFANIVNIIEDLKILYNTSKHELAALYDSLSQRAFRGKLNIKEAIGVKGSIEIPKIKNEDTFIDKINKELREFYFKQQHTGASTEIDNKIRQLDTELKIRGEVIFDEDYLKYKIVKANFKDVFTFEQLWQEITKFPFENLPDYDLISTILFKWLEEEDAFISQKFNDTNKQIELVINETVTA